ncbi:DUF2807 domain-containing protein [Aquimarina sp. TRL1]|nr:DUF2807 domain-containing protein [Aquimarina sp. TRL1]
MKRKRPETTVLVFLLFVIGGVYTSIAQIKSYEVKSFDKVIISPHIEVIFRKGEEEAVIVEEITEDIGKLNVEVNGKTLRIYLDGAKMVTKNEKIKKDGWKQSKPLYNGTVVKAVVTYKNIKSFSLRGEERFVMESPLVSDRLQLSIYGASQLIMKEVALKDMKVTMYGESFLEVKNGAVAHQKITAYGESKVSMLSVKNKETKITAYGEGSFRVNVSDRIKVTAYGEATVAYIGNPQIDRGIVIGEATIEQIREQL